VFFDAPPGEPTGLRQIRELLTVQQLVAQSAEERLGIAVLPRARRLDRELIPMPPLEIFLSRSSENRDTAEVIAGILRDHGVPAFYGSLNIVGAQQ
jgi:hypothetical protein